MSISDLYGTGEHLSNLGHFAAIVSLAAVNGKINNEEQEVLERFSRKLDINEEEFERILEHPGNYPIHPNHTYEERLERLHDLFTIIYSDKEVDQKEITLLKKYAIALGFSSATSEAIIKKSIQIFSGRIDFDDFKYLLDRN